MRYWFESSSYVADACVTAVTRRGLGLNLDGYGRYEAWAGLNLDGYDRYEAWAGLNPDGYDRYEAWARLNPDGYGRYDAWAGLESGGHSLLATRIASSARSNAPTSSPSLYRQATP